MTVDLDRNTEVQMVAVVPELREQGLAGKLLGHALADAGERGATGSTLIATQLGRPVYERAGFEEPGDPSRCGSSGLPARATRRAARARRT